MTEYVFIINPHAPLFVICRSADQRGLCSFSALSPHWSCRPTTSPNDSLWNFLGRFYSIGRTLTWWRGTSLMRLTWRWWWICCGIRARTFSSRRSMCSRLVRFTEIINGRTVLITHAVSSDRCLSQTQRSRRRLRTSCAETKTSCLHSWRISTTIKRVRQFVFMTWYSPVDGWFYIISYFRRAIHGTYCEPFSWCNCQLLTRYYDRTRNSSSSCKSINCGDTAIEVCLTPSTTTGLAYQKENVS